MKVLAFITVAIFALVSILPASEAVSGVDVSQAVSQSAWTCLKNNGNQFGIVRIYRSFGSADPNAATTIKNARSAGIKYVDGYIFPCKKCGNPKGQVQKAVQNLKSNGAVIGQIWIDVEGTQYWSSSKSDNVNFIRDMVDEGRAQGYVVGIYTSASQWTPITGGSTAFSNLQLWYAHYDNKPNFSDFKAFGGWSKPTIKQYQGDVTSCGVGVDKNWYP